MTQDTEDLLVFGYSCKLFRDDDRALLVDAGQLLVPWMGRQDFPIDRFDGRGHLHELQSLEAPPGGFDPRQFMTPEEKQIEDFCDDERYRFLTEDDLDARAREEEAIKREGQGQAAIGFDYNAPPPTAPPTTAPDPPSLKTLANCIEKTAEFIVSQGAQMEILMRAKEADNPKFQFLNPDNPYHPIYKQVLEKKRSRPKNYVANQALMRQASLEVEKSLQLLVSSQPNAAPNVSGTKYESSSSSGNAYSKLVERIRESQPPPPKSSVPEVTSGPPSPQNKTEEEPKKDENIVTVTPPPITMQPIIDKTASYVAKNGSDMLAVVRKQQPEMFSFLNADNKYNMFFQYKVALYTEMLAEKGELINPGGAAAKVVKNGAGNSDKTDEEQMQQVVATKFPTLKGFFR